MYMQISQSRLKYISSSYKIYIKTELIKLYWTRGKDSASEQSTVGTKYFVTHTCKLFLQIKFFLKSFNFLR